MPSRAATSRTDSPGDKLRSGLARAGRGSGGELVGLPAQLPYLQRRGIQIFVTSVIVVLQRPAGTASSGRSAASTTTSRTAWSSVGRLRA